MPPSSLLHSGPNGCIRFFGAVPIVLCWLFAFGWRRCKFEHKSVWIYCDHKIFSIADNAWLDGPPRTLWLVLHEFAANLRGKIHYRACPCFKRVKECWLNCTISSWGNRLNILSSLQNLVGYLFWRPYPYRQIFSKFLSKPSEFIEVDCLTMRRSSCAFQWDRCRCCAACCRCYCFCESQKSAWVLPCWKKEVNIFVAAHSSQWEGFAVDIWNDWHRMSRSQQLKFQIHEISRCRWLGERWIVRFK